MKEEIYKGKILNTDKWVEGLLYGTKDKPVIKQYFVDPKTVCKTEK